MSNGNTSKKISDISEDKKLLSTVAKLRTRINSVKDIVDKCVEKDMYTNASLEDRVKYDIFLAYATTSLFWAYLRASGIDPHNHSLKDEVDRIKNYMAKAKTVHDRHLRPKVNQDASKRFVRNALWTAPEKEDSDKTRYGPRKRKLFDQEES